MEIQINNWFKKLGQPLLGDNALLELVKNEEECAKKSSSLKWENLILYARNNFSAYLQHHHKEESKQWNGFAAAGRDHYDNELKPVVLKHLEDNRLAPEISDSIRSVVISFYIEDSFRKLLPALSFTQFETVMLILNEGRIPCGWNGPMTKNEGEDPIDFKKGKILVW